LLSNNLTFNKDWVFTRSFFICKNKFGRILEDTYFYIIKTNHSIMAQLEFRKAQRNKAKIRIGLSGVAGAGKTRSALLIAYGLCGDWGKIGVICSENKSADLESHLGDFHVIELDAPFTPERYREAISIMEAEKMEVIIIDSITHEWEGAGGILQMVDEIGGGFQGAWKVLTPRHEAFKQAIINSKCHIITTVRRKTEYVIVEEENAKGKLVKKPIKVGLKDITREGWDYEVTLNFELDITHVATATKDRTSMFIDKPGFIPTVETGELLRDWCELGIDPVQETKDGIAKLANCHTVEDLTTLKSILPPYVINSNEFKEAGTKRYNEIKPNLNTNQNK
jgi:nucleoside-triphosphatase THEP1